MANLQFRQSLLDLVVLMLFPLFYILMNRKYFLMQVLEFRSYILFFGLEFL